jgi:hypothetical protein
VSLVEQALLIFPEHMSFCKRKVEIGGFVCFIFLNDKTTTGADLNVATIKWNVHLSTIVIIYFVIKLRAMYKSVWYITIT